MYNYHTILLVFKEKVTGKTWVHGFFKATDAGLYKFKKEEQNPNLEISVFVLSHFERPDQPIYVPLETKEQFNALKAQINADYGLVQISKELLNCIYHGRIYNDHE